MVWGTISSLGAFAEGVGKVLNYPLLGLYEFMVLPGRKTIMLGAALENSLRIFFLKNIFFQ